MVRNTSSDGAVDASDWAVTLAVNGTQHVGTLEFPSGVSLEPQASVRIFRSKDGGYDSGADILWAGLVSCGQKREGGRGRRIRRRRGSGMLKREGEICTATDRQTDTDRQTQTDTDTDRHRHTQTQTQTHRHRHRHTHTDTHTHTFALCLCLSVACTARD